MDSDRRDFPVLADGHNDEVERYPPVDGRAPFGLRHERHLAPFLEVMHGAKAAALVSRRTGDAENTERLGRRLVRLLDLVAEQGHGAVGEPVEERRTFL